MINAATTAALTITLDAPETIGTLLLGSGTPGLGYTLSGSGSNKLTFNNAGNNAPAQISVIDGTHVINSPVILADNLMATSRGTNPWTLSFGTASSITDNGAGLSLTMGGSGGMLILSGTNNYSGGTFLEAGTLIATNPAAIADGTNLTVGNAAPFAPVTPELAVRSLTASPVPEPGTLALLSVAICGAAVNRRLRSRRRQQ